MAPPVDRHALIHTVFKALDADDSGEVDEEEFMSMFSDAESKNAKRFLLEIDNMRGNEAGGDGKLNMKEFCEFMVEYTTHMREKDFIAQISRWHINVAGSARRLLLRRVFNAMDVDRSGSITLEEFRALAGAEEAENAADLFRRIEGDEGDGNGELTVDEWVPFVLDKEQHRTDDEFQAMVDEMLVRVASQKRETLLRQVFLKMDADSSGSVDKEEFENLKDGGPEDVIRLNRIYAYLDEANGDSDGELSIDEWVSGMKAMGEDMSDEEFEAEISKWLAALSKNQRAVWRGVFVKGYAHDFVMAARAAGCTHALFVQNAHATVDGCGTEDEDWAHLATSIENLKQTGGAHKRNDDCALPGQTPDRQGLPRPASGSILRPISPNVKRASSAHPSSRMGVSKSTPALTADGYLATSPAPAWADPVDDKAAAPDVAPDLMLTHRGTAQCMIARLMWYKRFPARTLMMCSPARCAKETALHYAGRAGGGVEAPKDPSKLLCVCDKLAPTAPSSLCAELIKTKTRQEEIDDGIFATAPPLKVLLDAEGGESSLGLYAEAACEELTDKLRGAEGYLAGKTESKTTYVPVFGHPGYIHAVAYAVAAAAGMGHADLDKLLLHGLNDAEALLVPLYGAEQGKMAVHLKRPR